MINWEPWKGCHRKSAGCANCYIFRANDRKGIDNNIVYQTDEFNKPIVKDNKGNYRIMPGQVVFTCFRSDFLLEDADPWRAEAWEMIRTRADLTFFFLTKRIERFEVALPDDYGENFGHVSVGCTIEDQKTADERLAVFTRLPIRRKIITIQPMLERVDISLFLSAEVECVVVGGESGKDTRPLDYEWVLDIRRQCVDANVSFEFRQVGSNFIKDGKTYQIQRQILCQQARKAGIDFRST